MNGNISNMNLKPRGGIKLSNALDYQHYAENSNNLHPLKCLPFKISKPYLLYNPALTNSYEDEYIKLLRMKHKFNKKVNCLRTTYQKKKAKCKKNIDILEYYKKMQDLLDTDPDKYFNSNYNWYYSGGNLDIVTTPSNLLLISANNNSNLSFTGLTNESKLWKTTFQKHLNLSNTIYEVQSTIQNNDLLVGVRTKNKFYLFNVDSYDNENIAWDLLKENKNKKIPYVSFALNPNKLSQYVTLNVEQTAEIWDVNKNLPDDVKVTKIRNTDGENWAQIKYLNENTLFYINNISFSQTDIRQNFHDTKLLSELNLQHTKYEKEYFTNACIKNEHNLYLTTNKFIVEYDLRMEKIINKWSHFLKESIFLSDKCNNLLFVATENFNERLILGSDFESLNMPLLAPNLNDSFNDCILNKHTIDLGYAIRERNLFSTTGIKILKNNENYSIFTSNSIGDVYVNDFYTNDFDSNEILNRNTVEFKKLNDTMLVNVDKTNPLYYSDKTFTKSLNFVLKTHKPINKQMQSEKRQYYLNKTKNDLKKNVDKCRSFLNEAWDVDRPITQIEEIESNLNVQMWLSKINEEDVDDNILEENNLVTNDDTMFDELHESVSQFV